MWLRPRLGCCPVKGPPATPSTWVLRSGRRAAVNLDQTPASRVGAGCAQGSSEHQSTCPRWRGCFPTFRRLERAGVKQSFCVYVSRVNLRHTGNKSLWKEERPLTYGAQLVIFRETYC